MWSGNSKTDERAAARAGGESPCAGCRFAMKNEPLQAAAVIWNMSHCVSLGILSQLYTMD